MGPLDSSARNAAILSSSAAAAAASRCCTCAEIRAQHPSSTVRRRGPLSPRVLRLACLPSRLARLSMQHAMCINRQAGHHWPDCAAPSPMPHLGGARRLEPPSPLLPRSLPTCGLSAEPCEGLRRPSARKRHHSQTVVLLKGWVCKGCSPPPLVSTGLGNKGGLDSKSGSNPLLPVWQTGHALDACPAPGWPWQPQSRPLRPREAPSTHLPPPTHMHTRIAPGTHLALAAAKSSWLRRTVPRAPGLSAHGTRPAPTWPWRPRSRRRRPP